MKRVLVIFCLFMYVVFSACSKVSGPANGKSIQPNNHLDSTVADSASINGAKWKTDSAYGYSVKYSGNDSAKSDLMIIANQVNTSSSMTMYITNYSGVGTYPINPPLVSITYITGNKRYFGTTGNITIASNAYPSLIGSFTFTADTLEVTGAFNVALP
jgi:hypothetical protein